jgi:hypothetical protein
MSCDISPPDFTTEVGKVRYYSGDTSLNEEGSYIVPDYVIQEILDEYVLRPANVRVWRATLDTLLFMKAAMAPYAARSREREGSVEVELYGQERYQAICDLWDFYDKNPDVIVKDAVRAPIIIGGVRLDKFCNVIADGNSHYSGSRISPYSNT